MESLLQKSVLHEVEVSDDLDLQKTPNQPQPQQSLPEQYRNLSLLWHSRQFLLRVLLWSIAATVVVSLLIPKRYESTITVMPPDSLQGNLGASVLAAVTGKADKADAGLASVAGGLLGLKSSGALYVELLHSRTVQDRLVDRYQLQKVWWIRYREDARNKLEHRTSISEDHKSGVITVTVTDSDQTRARELAQGYVEELNSLLARVTTSSARRERMFIEQRLVSVKQDLSDAEKQFSVFASNNTALDIKEQTKAMVESAALLQGQLMAAESEVQSLAQVYTPSNVRVRAAEARVAELRRQLQKMGGQGSTVSESASAQDIYPSIRELPLLGVEWADLYRRMKIQETVYELLNQQYEMARIQEAKEIPTVNVVDPANYPEKKSFPPRSWIVVIGTLVLCSAGVGWVIGLDKWSRLKDDDPRKQLVMQIRDGASARWPSLVARIDRIAYLHSPDQADPL